MVNYSLMSGLPSPIQIPFYQGTLSCGLFGISDDFSSGPLSLDQKFIKSPESTFFIRAGGDSMAPHIKAGDILIVDRSLALFSQAVGAFFYNGHAVCKQFLKTKTGIILHSFNSHYTPIKITPDDCLELFGVVTGLAREFYKSPP